MSEEKLTIESDVYQLAQELHTREDDWHEGDIGARIEQFSHYVSRQLDVSKLNPHEYFIDEDKVDEYLEQIKASDGSCPPIIFDEVNDTIIDGAHRVAALQKGGFETVDAFVGTEKFYTPMIDPDDDCDCDMDDDDDEANDNDKSIQTFKGHRL